MEIWNKFKSFVNKTFSSSNDTCCNIFCSAFMKTISEPLLYFIISYSFVSFILSLPNQIVLILSSTQVRDGYNLIRGIVKRSEELPPDNELSGLIDLNIIHQFFQNFPQLNLNLYDVQLILLGFGCYSLIGAYKSLRQVISKTITTILCYLNIFQNEIPFLEWQCNSAIVIGMPMYIISKIVSGNFYSEPTALLYEIPSILCSIFVWLQWRCYACKINSLVT